MMLIYLIWTILVILFILYKYYTRNFNYWKKRGVFYLKPIPFFGNFYETFSFKTTIAQGLKKLYDQTDRPYFGAFVFDTPVLILRSPKLIEHILIRDFKYFKNRSLASPKHNPIIANFMIFQKYTEWKKTRSKMSTLFSNMKLKGMFYATESVVEEMNNYLRDNIGIIEAKDMASRFSTDVIIRCFFGINSTCFKNDKTKIFKISKRSFDFSLRNAFCQGLYVFKPQWVDLFKLNFMMPKDQEYLINAVMDVVESRKINKRVNEKAMDYIDVILETKENENNLDASKPGLTEVLSNSLQFFLAGTETMSGLQSFCLYELSVNPTVQNKLRNEILEVVNKYGSITFESLNDMNYMECCLFETMRKYVSLQIIDRVAEEDYPIPETNFVIEKGTIVYIPFYAVHNDETYYPDPDKYIPERFLEQSVNQDGLNFLPFGAGPRICLGLTEVLSNSLQFFLAGTETMSGLQSFCLYELSVNPTVQNKLRNEILEVVNKYGSITFESLNDMNYMECCLFETMRKYVSLQIIDRVAEEDYPIPETNFVIEKGTIVYIPFYAVHNDETYYPDPDKYIPERFLEQSVNQDGLNFLPFGAGPRICLGERFAMIMTKYMLASIISSYELKPFKETPIPIKLEPKAFTFQSSVGIPLKIRPVNET